MTTLMHDDDIVIHPAPVRRDRANFMIRASIEEADSPRRFEQLWARQIAAHRFEVCCIPFFVYDLALGDEVETNGDYVVERVVRRSGGYTFRAWFGDSVHPAVRKELPDELRFFDPELEWYSDNLVAIHVAKEFAQDVADILERREQRAHLTYETART